SFCRKASSAEASSTASAMGFPFGFLPAIAEQLVRQRDARRGGVGEIRLNFADHAVQGSHDDAGLRRLEHDRVARLDAVEVAKLGGDGNAAAFAQLGMDDTVHEIANYD